MSFAAYGLAGFVIVAVLGVAYFTIRALGAAREREKSLRAANEMARQAARNLEVARSMPDDKLDDFLRGKSP